MPVSTYGHMYDHLDVALVPLVANEFNACKSELKIVEAGAKKCAVISSNVDPYKNIPGVTYANKPIDFYHAVKKLTDKSYREDMANLLHEFILTNFDLQKVEYETSWNMAYEEDEQEKLDIEEYQLPPHTD